MVLKLIPPPLRPSFDKATPIQRKAIPLALKGLNLLLMAPAGSGKTEAALLPILTSYLKLRGGEGWRTGIYILYVTPLRALNRDMLGRLKELCEKASIKVDVRHGDTPRRVRKMQAREPPELLITTPETLQVILCAKHMRGWLRNVRWVIVDEVHSIVGNKRGVQLAAALERLKELVGRQIQIIGLSATVGTPEGVLKFLVGVKGSGVIVDGSASKKYEIAVELCTPSQLDFKLAEKLQCRPRFASRIRRICELVSGARAALVFTNCREHAEFISSRLKILGLNVATHHSSLSKDSRSEVEELLKRGRLEGVVCTSSLELGIDIGEVDLCIQHLSPRRPSNLLQRVGRSGHSLYRVSKGVILAGGPDDFLEASMVAYMALKWDLEASEVEESALDVLAHQVAGIALGYGAISLETLYKIVSSSYPYRGLKLQELRSLVDYMVSLGLIGFDNGYVKTTGKTRRYYFKHVSTIPEEMQYPVFEESTGRLLGHLGEDFYGTYGKTGVKLVLNGLPWVITRLQGLNVYVERAEDYLAAIPGWEGEVLPTPFKVALRVGALRREVEALYEQGLSIEEASKLLASKYPGGPESFREALKPLYEQLGKGYPNPTDRRILVESFRGYIVIHVCGGHGVNRCIARILSHVLSEKYGVETIARWDAYRILLMASALPETGVIADILRQISLEECESILRSSVDSYVMRHIALKFDAIPESTYYKSMSYLATLPDRFKNTPIYEETLRFQLKNHYSYGDFQKLLGEVKAGKVEVKTLENLPNPTPLARPIFDLVEAAYMAGVKLFKERVFSKAITLACLDCLHRWISLLRETPEKPTCPNCGGENVTLLKWRKNETLEVLRKLKEGAKLDDEEDRIALNAQMSSDLVKLYGRKALVALSVRGVGPLTAYPILAKRHSSEEEFLEELKDAMQEYLETRDHWDD